MSRRRERQEETFSLFPFLAVLLCTMGMLVMLLVLMSKGASNDRSGEAVRKVPAAQKAPSAEDPNLKEYQHLKKVYGNASREDLQEEIASAQWYLDELKGIKVRTEEALRKERDRLTAADKAIAERLKDLNKLKEGIRLLKEDKSENPENIAAKIKIKSEEIIRLEKEIADSREKIKNAKPSYSIIPYQGKSGTVRYPIYIECNERGVFLMPEGIPFSVEDFLLGKYPGNPFDMAIRTARQCILEKEANGSNDLEKEPYPLLIVRPGGSDKYYTAVSALASWGGDYGYELVEEDWKLDYPPADPDRAHRIQEQIALSRSRLAIPLATMIAEMSRQGAGSRSESDFGGFSSLRKGSGIAGSSLTGAGTFGSGPGSSSLQNQLGDQVKLAPVSGLGGSPGSAGGLPGGQNPVPAQTSGPYGNPSGSYAQNTPNTPNGGERLGVSFLAGTSGGAGDYQSLPAYQGAYSDLNAGGKTNGPDPASSIGQNGSPSALLPNGSQFSPNGSLAQQTGSSVPQTESPAPQNGNYQQLTPYGPAVEGDQTAGTPVDPSRQLLAKVQDQGQTPSAQNDSDQKPGNWETVGNTAYQQNGQGTSPAGSPYHSSSQIENGNLPGAGPMLSVDKKMKDCPEPKKDPVAGFASSEMSGKAFNLTELTYKKADAATERPISIECFADKIVFPKQPGIRKTETISTGIGKDQFQKDLFQSFVLCVKTWGVAGRNMYWTPWIKAKVHPGGEQTFFELQKIFQTQGITVKNYTD
ncbi:MAG: hypothetical protein Q4G69_04405 [Planctomycetia bacterium]|nr:hypothetical protein [Planctomycetia bacterium]